MRRPSALCALALLGWLLACPLASAGVFPVCHEDEAAMDCCLPHEGSGSQPLAKVMTATAPPVALSAVGAEPRVTSTAAVASRAEPVLPTGGPRLHSLLSVFLV